MKTKLQITAIITSFFAFQTNAQNKTTISATNSEISDNLDLTAVSSIFGESENLTDFERRLNDPKLQISNLDLNNDNRVDYLRVIESVENRTHVVIIQSVIGRDLYQDIATIEIEKNSYNKISIQIVGNAFIYGQNYIYEPVYCNTPQIYASFWVNYYQPYYYAWNPYPVYRYRQNVYGCVNYSNTYNYVSYRSCYRAPVIYNTYSCNSYERQYPQYAFSRRNSNASNRYELDQRRYSANRGSKNEVASTRNNPGYSRNYANSNSNTQREYTQNRTNTTKEVFVPKTGSQREYTANRSSIQKTEPQREYAQNRTSYSNESNNPKVETKRDYSQNRSNSSREFSTQKE